MGKLKGTFVVMVTPFNSEDKVDFDGFEKNIEWYLEKGVHGVIPTGSTGEFVSLTAEERKEIVEFVLQTVNRRVPVCVGASAETTQKAIEFSQHAKESGADAVMLLPPYYYKPLGVEMVDHFTKIAKEVDIPIMVYNNPWTTGVDFELKDVLEAAKEKNIEYIKESTGDIKRLREIDRLAKEKITPFCGWDDLALESFFCGAQGWVSVIANIFPEESSKLFELAVIEKNYEEAKVLYNKLLPICCELEYSGKLVQVTKYCMDRIGRVGGYFRSPRSPLDDDHKKRIDKLLEEAVAV